MPQGEPDNDEDFMIGVLRYGTEDVIREVLAHPENAPTLFQQLRVQVAALQPQVQIRRGPENGLLEIKHLNVRLLLLDVAWKDRSTAQDGEMAEVRALLEQHLRETDRLQCWRLLVRRLANGDLI